MLLYAFFSFDLLSCLAAEGGVNAAEYEAPASETWAHGFMSREPALVNTFTREGYLSGLLSSAAEVGTLAFLCSFVWSFIRSFVRLSFVRSFVYSFPFSQSFLHPYASGKPAQTGAGCRSSGIH